jgi:hypothetical protein
VKNVQGRTKIYEEHKSCLKLFYDTVRSNKELLVLTIRNETSHEIVCSESCQLISDLKRKSIYNPMGQGATTMGKTWVPLPAGEMFWTDTDYVAVTNSMNVGIKWSFKTTSKEEEKELEQLISILLVWNNGQGVTKIQVLPSSTVMTVKATVCNLGQIPYELPNQFELLLVGELLQESKTCREYDLDSQELEITLVDIHLDDNAISLNVENQTKN